MDAFNIGVILEEDMTVVVATPPIQNVHVVRQAPQRAATR